MADKNGMKYYMRWVREWGVVGIRDLSILTQSTLALFDQLFVFEITVAYFTVPQGSVQNSKHYNGTVKWTAPHAPFDLISTLCHKKALRLAMNSKVTLWIDHNVGVAIAFVG